MGVASWGVSVAIIGKCLDSNGREVRDWKFVKSFFPGKRRDKVVESGEMFGVGVLRVGGRNGVKRGHVRIGDLITGECGSE